MTGAQDLVHASAYHMVVVEEPLAEARARIAASKGGEITGVRRPAGLSAAGADVCALVKHAEQPKQNDDGDRDADQPEKNAAHG